MSLAPVELHYVNNAPFAVAKTLERTLDVAWGKIHVEERYVVVSHRLQLTLCILDTCACLQRIPELRWQCRRRTAAPS